MDGVASPCPPVRDDMVTPRHLFLNSSDFRQRILDAIISGEESNPLGLNINDNKSDIKYDINNIKLSIKNKSRGPHQCSSVAKAILEMLQSFYNGTASGGFVSFAPPVPTPTKPCPYQDRDCIEQRRQQQLQQHPHVTINVNSKYRSLQRETAGVASQRLNRDEPVPRGPPGPQGPPGVPGVAGQRGWKGQKGARGQPCTKSLCQNYTTKSSFTGEGLCVDAYC